MLPLEVIPLEFWQSFGMTEIKTMGLQCGLDSFTVFLRYDINRP